MFQFEGPIVCPRPAFELMRTMVKQTDHDLWMVDPLIDGALAISALSGRPIDGLAFRRSLANIIDAVKSRYRGNNANALVAHLHTVLFDEMKFTGNTKNYHAIANSDIVEVMITRTGLPITLSLLYFVVASRLGLDVRGLSLPGHFCVGVVVRDKLMIVDPFYAGRVLNEVEALQRVRDTYGPGVQWSDSMLEPVKLFGWLTRILQNLMHTASSSDQNLALMAGCLELEIVMWPDLPHLWRDLGLVLARMGRAEPARSLLIAYLGAKPDDPQANDLRELLGVLE